MNAQRQEEAVERIQKAIEKLNVVGKPITLNAIVVEAHCSKSTAKRVLQELEEGTGGTGGTGGTVRTGTGGTGSTKTSSKVRNNAGWTENEGGTGGGYGTGTVGTGSTDGTSSKVRINPGGIRDSGGTGGTVRTGTGNGYGTGTDGTGGTCLPYLTVPNQILKDATTTAREDQVPILDEVPTLTTTACEDTSCNQVPILDGVPILIHDEYFEVEQLAVSLMQRPMLGSDELLMLKNLTESGVPISTIVQGIRESFANYKPRTSRDKIARLTYCQNHILDLHDKLTCRHEVGVEKYATNRSFGKTDPGANRETSGKFAAFRNYSSV